ncbi:hypothetical protein J4Q44_G00145350 [Coregonus suidteri]|uniref:Uncharacterized protein n=1 Tax=Coregonus suidteri TaxID=861788 RepID=A0AAN8QX51_9TELE
MLVNISELRGEVGDLHLKEDELWRSQVRESPSHPCVLPPVTFHCVSQGQCASLLIYHTHTLVEASCQTTKYLSQSILHTLCSAVPCLCIYSVIKPPQLESYLSVICALTSTQERTHKVKPNLKNVQSTESSLTVIKHLQDLSNTNASVVEYCRQYFLEHFPQS